MFWAEIWKISVFYLRIFSFFGGEIFYIFDYACFRNEAAFHLRGASHLSKGTFSNVSAHTIHLRYIIAWFVHVGLDIWLSSLWLNACADRLRGCTGYLCLRCPSSNMYVIIEILFCISNAIIILTSTAKTFWAFSHLIMKLRCLKLTKILTHKTCLKLHNL